MKLSFFVSFCCVSGPFESIVDGPAICHLGTSNLLRFRGIGIGGDPPFLPNPKPLTRVTQESSITYHLQSYILGFA